SGILETEPAYRRRDPASGALPAEFRYRGAHNTFSLAAFAREALQLAGPAVVISSACSSSAKVFASARRAIEAGLIDAALVGGVDSLCLTTLYGFHSLQLVSRGPGTPSNDEAACRAGSGVLGTQVPASSTKGATGHTLGAAGALEAVICALALRHGLMPAGVNTNEVDPALAVHYLLENRAAPL